MFDLNYLLPSASPFSSPNETIEYQENVVIPVSKCYGEVSITDQYFFFLLSHDGWRCNNGVSVSCAGEASDRVSQTSNHARLKTLGRSGKPLHRGSLTPETLPAVGTPRHARLIWEEATEK